MNFSAESAADHSSEIRTRTIYASTLFIKGTMYQYVGISTALSVCGRIYRFITPSQYVGVSTTLTTPNSK